MPSSPSTNLRLELQATGENVNAWGQRLNTAIELVEEALTGVLPKSLTGNVTLTSTNYASDEARHMVLKFTDGGLSANATVTVPAVEKVYIVHNAGATYDVILTAGGTTATVGPGEIRLVYVDGTNCILETNADLAAVAAIAADVTAVAAIDTDVSAVAAIDSDVTTVAGISANVTTVATNSANVSAVAGNATNINTVAGISADVTTVAGDSADIQAVAADATDIGTVATNISNVSAVAAIDSDVTTVAGVAANVTTVAGISADVTAVAAVDTEVGTVAGIAADVTAVAGISSADLAAVAAIDTEVGTVAGISADVTTVAGIAADVTFVATNGVVPGNRTLTAGTGLTGGGDLSANRTFAVDVGTGANQIVRLDGSARLPAVDGSQLTNVPIPAEVATPTNVSPANAATDITETPTLTGSTYYSLYGKTQKSSQWQVSTVSDFASTAYDSGEVVAVGVTHAVPAGNLSTSQLYYWRTRYRDSDDTWSDWSTATTFTTAAFFNNFVATPAAIPSIGASHAGGFYFGQIWDEITTSATSTAIGTGSKTFTVTDAAPLFYSGQDIKIVSRGDAGNRVMEGTVTGSSGTTLTVNITSVTGSGTYTDWSVLVKYRLIIAPKSSGENASVAYKNANTAAPTATQTLTNGPAATAAMVAADTSTVYPLAHWADGLSIGGFSDWYVPARDELELIWTNLKPVTNNNDTSNRSKSSIAYTNGGNADDLSADTHGVNRHSDPAGVAYTSTVPAQTSVAAFQSGGAEALEFGSALYWSSSEYSSSVAWFQYYLTSFPGYQVVNSKTLTYRARAVRRSIV